MFFSLYDTSHCEPFLLKGTSFECEPLAPCQCVVFRCVINQSTDSLFFFFVFLWKSSLSPYCTQNRWATRRYDLFDVKSKTNMICHRTWNNWREKLKTIKWIEQRKLFYLLFLFRLVWFGLDCSLFRLLRCEQTFTYTFCCNDCYLSRVNVQTIFSLSLFAFFMHSSYSW